MTGEKKNDRTVLDKNMARPRLKEGLVPDHTGIFLKVERGSQAGATLTLSAGGTYLIGREDADINIHDEKVSRKHAELSLLGPGAYFVRDLASTNGTFLNGKRVTEERRPISNDDRIRVGDTVMLFALVEQSIKIP